MRFLLAGLAWSLLTCALPPRACGADVVHAIRVATFNASLADDRHGGLQQRLAKGDAGARKAAAIIQWVRPDILLINEFDYDAGARSARLFLRRYLAVSQYGQRPVHYPYRYLAPVNTGVPSHLDIDRDGQLGSANDAWGFGHQPGQYGMLVLSRFPIDAARARSFRLFRWSRMPGALAPSRGDGAPYYDRATWQRLRLSSKSHWDVPIATPFGTLHFLVHHPTPPVFDGPEDRNGARNHDEIRLWADYIDPAHSAYLVDDRGRSGGLADGARFIIAGDHNADPLDGDSAQHAMDQLLQHARIDARHVPTSCGAAEAALRDGGANRGQRGDPAADTGNFGPRVGNLRIDYVLPSKGLRVMGQGVFWPCAGQLGHAWLDASDHRLVWLDVRW